MRWSPVLVAAVLVTAVLAGCAQPEASTASSSTAKAPPSTTSNASRSTATATATAAPVNNATLAYEWVPTAPTVGEAVQFHADVKGLGSRTVKSWAWDFGDDIAATQQATHVYEDPGQRGFLVRAQLSDGTEVFANDLLTVLDAGAQPEPEPVPGGLPGEAGCTSDTVANPRPDAWYMLGKPAQAFGDPCFHQYTVNRPDTATIDAMILPPPGAATLRDANLLRASVRMWGDGLKAGANATGLDWLRDGLTITPLVVGEDIPAGPSAAMPDILVVIEDVAPDVVLSAYAGIGTDVPLSFCHPLMAERPTAAMARSLPTYDDHHGRGWGTASVACENGSRVCLVVGAVVPFDTSADAAHDVYDLNSHEFGHCLGLGHVGDASDFAAIAYPPDDIMSYEQDPHAPGYALCVSNLDLKTAAAVYQPLIAGAPSLGFSPVGGYVVMEGGSNPVGSDLASIIEPLPESSWRIFTADGKQSPDAADCIQPDTALVQTPP